MGDGGEVASLCQGSLIAWGHWQSVRDCPCLVMGRDGDLAADASPSVRAVWLQTVFYSSTESTTASARGGINDPRLSSIARSDLSWSHRRWQRDGKVSVTTALLIAIRWQSFAGLEAVWLFHVESLRSLRASQAGWMGKLREHVHWCDAASP